MTTDRKCSTCDGCGRVANDDEGTPWKYWAELPVQSALAVLTGAVRPLTCPNCAGTGRVVVPGAVTV